MHTTLNDKIISCNFCLDVEATKSCSAQQGSTASSNEASMQSSPSAAHWHYSAGFDNFKPQVKCSRWHTDDLFESTKALVVLSSIGLQ